LCSSTGDCCELGETVSHLRVSSELVTPGIVPHMSTNIRCISRESREIKAKSCKTAAYNIIKVTFQAECRLINYNNNAIMYSVLTVFDSWLSHNRKVSVLPPTAIQFEKRFRHEIGTPGYSFCNKFQANKG